MKVIGIYGPVGSGKSSLLEELKLSIPNSYVVPEYIDKLPDAETKLKMYLEGSISSFEFQQYILDYFERTANELQNSSYDFIFVERLPVEGIQFFAKLDLQNGRMTNEQYEELLRRAKSLTFYPDPSNESELTRTITIKTDYLSPHQISQKVIHQLISSNVRIIKLRAELQTLKERIIRRGRECEIEHYSDDYLKIMIERYD